MIMNGAILKCLEVLNNASVLSFVTFPWDGVSYKY